MKLVLATLSSGVDARKKSDVKLEYVSPSRHNFSASSQDFQKGINDRVMPLRLPLSGKRHAYAPTMTNQIRLKISSMMIWIL